MPNTRKPPWLIRNGVWTAIGPHDRQLITYTWGEALMFALAAGHPEWGWEEPTA